MRILSYSESLQQYDLIESFVKTMDISFQILSFIEKNNDEELRKMMGSLEREDIVVFVSLIGVFANSSAFFVFILFCRRHDIRIVSIQEKIDTADLLFDSPCSFQWVSVLCSMYSMDDGNHNDIQSDMLAYSFHDRMLKRHLMVINLYTANYSLSDIRSLTGFSKTHIYRLLRKYGVKLAYPSMQRKRNDS